MKLDAQTIEKLKKKEIEMLEVFIDLCRKLNLKYYILGGTLLGAVRHQGFIPWDDDIDVCMPREDYEIFLEKGQELLPENLFIQNFKTDPNFSLCFAKIRDSQTAFIETSVKNLKINHGVFIDIFPLDYYPEDSTEQKKIEKKKKYYTNAISKIYTIERKGFVKKLKGLVKKLVFLFVPYKKCVKELDSLYKSQPVSTLYANHCGAWGKKEITPVHWFGEGVELRFEGIKVNAPSMYHEWLTQVYGDYMQLPPEEKRVAHHYVEVVDLEKSYKECIK